MSISIEKAVPADAAELLAFYKQVGGETDNLTFSAGGIPTTVEAEAEHIARLENSRDNIIFVAKEKGKIMGDASLRRQSRRMSHRGSVGISVVKEHWNRGVGGRLLSGIIDFARENSFDIVELQVRSDNFPAIHLYEKYGFQKICTYPAFFKIGGQYIDVDFMYLPLNNFD